MKILMVYGGPKCYLGNFIEAMSKYADVEGCNIFGAENLSIPYEIDLPVFREVSHTELTSDKIKEYDCVIGLDNGCIDFIHAVKAGMSVRAGCLILDYPTHTFKANKDYNERATNCWNQWKKKLSFFDFLIHCRENAQKDLAEYSSSIPKVFHPLPCKIFLDEFPSDPRSDYVMYSGAVNPAKGVHYIISALSLIENAPELVVVGQGDDKNEIAGFANFLKVKYIHYRGISEKDKFALYRGAKAIVYGHDTGVIPGLCVLEGIGVGKNAICWDFDEHKVMYRGFADYASPLNISEFSWLIEEELRNPKDNSRGIEYVRDKCSFDSWAQTVYKFLETT